MQAVLEREGIGPSVWGTRDRITLVRALIRELSGGEPTFDRPTWAKGMTERVAILRAPREYGSVIKGWTGLLDADPLLKRSDGPLKPGNGGSARNPAGWPSVGQDYEIWARSATGLVRVVSPPALVWEILCRS